MTHHVLTAGRGRARASRALGLAAMTCTVAALAGCGSPSPAAVPQVNAPSTTGSRTTGSTSTPAVESSTTAAAGSPSGTAAPAAATSRAGSTPARPTSAPGTAATPPPGAPATAAATAAPVAGVWALSTRYTAVESFHNGAPQAVNGCPPGADECSNGSTPLGSYPSDFLDAVRAQGAGRITSGTYSGRYLTWDADSGYAIDTAVLDDSEKPMVAYVSAGGDPGLVGTAFTVLDCGLDGGHAPSATACSRIRSASWTVRVAARQTGNAHLLELYIGEEDGPGFESGPRLLHTAGARTSLP